MKSAACCQAEWLRAWYGFVGACTHSYCCLACLSALLPDGCNHTAQGGQRRNISAVLVESCLGLSRLCDRSCALQVRTAAWHQNDQLLLTAYIDQPGIRHAAGFRLNIILGYRVWSSRICCDCTRGQDALAVVRIELMS